ncbi:hypothetical protein [Candidatus Nitrososphaera sp. FF02]|uniref:hypothetical protein n=1 Tax=Candidatus Nitrososphaera sp. FF02 TaxID=3398226 RepID=UPI0039E963B6
MPTYRLTIECQECSTDHYEHCNKACANISHALSYASPCSIKEVRMLSDVAGNNLVRPRVVVDYWKGEPMMLVQATDNLLLRLGIEGVTAVVSELMSHAVEGAVTGGTIGAATGASKKDGMTILAGIVLGALAGAIVGELAKDSITRLIIKKEYGVWQIVPLTSGHLA